MPPDPTVAALLRPDGSVIVPASVAGDVLRALVRDLTARIRADGGEISPRIRALLYALHAADQQDTPGFPTETPTAPADTVELGMREVAALLECSPQYARRLARNGSLPARRAGRIWLVDPTALDAFRKGHAA
ncbi:helix-turn-helix domain-containing protein [Streptomyces deccanensis]|uniref:helix-turn-helix domain-containing protein n=1 Tax=Streptomyces deccanensis TaxID=424188 RepID=UPI001EFB5BC6|nr:helix-turn-helix domain-containing protein [Streptomyces deccanensis]ULR50593.1 helix-turn-helix domain-containing protein [Streptomyces deccanensis]